MKDHPLSAVRDCLFNIFAATIRNGDRSSIRNPRMRHAVVIGTNLLSVYRLCNIYRPFQGSSIAICNVGSLSNNMTRNWNGPEILVKCEMALRMKKKNYLWSWLNVDLYWLTLLRTKTSNCRYREISHWISSYLTLESVAISFRTTSFNTQNFNMPLSLLWLFCVDLRTDSDFCFTHY